MRGSARRRSREIPVLVSVPRFAALVDVSERHVWALIADGSVPAIRAGRRRLVPLRAALLALGVEPGWLEPRRATERTPVP